MNYNFWLVNNTTIDIDLIMPVLKEVYQTRVIPEDYTDIFTVRFVKNPDTTDRMILEWA